MKKNILEDINRMKLFMGYNSKLTLKENEIKLNTNLLFEGAGSEALKLFFKETDKVALERAAKEAVEFDRTIAKELGKSADSIAKEFAKGTLTNGEALRVLKGFVDNKYIAKELEEEAIKIITNQEQFISKYENVTEYAKSEYMEAELVRKGYTKQQAEKLTKAFREQRPEFFKEPIPVKEPVKPEPVKPEPGKPEPGKPEPGKPEPKKWTKRTWNWIKTNWKKLALAGGALWLLWYWFKDEQKIFPVCLLNLMSEQDLEQSSQGDGEIVVSKLKIPDLDKLGGGTFFTNGDFETKLVGYKGTWERDGNTFLIVVGGQNYTFDCKNDEKPPVPKPDDGDKDDTKPKDERCSTLPMKPGCIDNSSEEYIKDIQECLGLQVTNKLDPATVQKLKEKYGVDTLDQDTYNKIMKDCYETIDDSKFTQI